MKGLLYIDKPVGWTSFDVVAYVRKMVARVEGKKPRNVKVGHTGTLDPAATGLLILCVGKEYTKKVPTLIKQDKTYEVELILGQISTTGDREGELTAVSEVEPSADDVKEAVESFVGEILQTPPSYSAVKVGGKRAYQLAREGKEVKIAPRTVHIHSIDDLKYDYPKVTFTTRVGSGTYIRSLADDIGSKLTTGAYMSALRRTSIADVQLSDAVSVESLDEKVLEKSLKG